MTQNKNCDTCIHSISREPEKTGSGPDYSFNQSIIDALKNGKSVWFYNEKIEIWIETFPYATFKSYTISEFVKSKWSLTKPKVMIKKQIKRWANIFESGQFVAFEKER